MFDFNHPEYFLPLIIGYVDVGTGQVIASTIGPILAGALSFLLGIFGFFLLRFKKIFKRSHRKSCQEKESSSSESTD